MSAKRFRQLWVAHEACLAEIQQASEADIDLETEHENPVDAGDHSDVEPEADAHERVFLWPKIPRGISRSVRIRMAKPMAGFQGGLKNSEPDASPSPHGPNKKSFELIESGAVGKCFAAEHR